MATHSSRDGVTSGVELPASVPFDLPYLTRMSWELGSRVVEDDESTLHSKWSRTGTPWTLSIFHVTSNTALLNVCTPVGRERFYGAARSDLKSALSSLDATPYWQQVE